MASHARFDWTDPFLLDSQLEPDERAVRDAAAAYCHDRLQPRVVQAFRHETTDPAIFREMGELGLLGPTIPEAYGGAGLNYVCYGLIAREVERVDSGYRSMMSVQSSLVMVPIFEFGRTHAHARTETHTHTHTLVPSEPLHSRLFLALITTNEEGKNTQQKKQQTPESQANRPRKRKKTETRMYECQRVRTDQDTIPARGVDQGRLHQQG